MKNKDRGAKISSGHGGNILATAKELNCSVSELIDMSSNLGPLGMVPGLREELANRLEEIEYLPETGSETVCTLFADKYGLSCKQILVGNGTTEYIYAVPAALQPKRAVIFSPTYSDYHLSCQWAGIPVADFFLQQSNDFRLDLNFVETIIRSGDLVFLCNPNNPTGGVVSSAELYDFIGRYPECTFLVDESYLPFVRQPSLLRFALPDNLFVLVSFSKIFCIPGLRLGFLASAAKNMAIMSARRKPWGVNRMAQIAGEFIISHGNHFIDNILEFLEKERPRFIAALGEISEIDVIPGEANFILCHLNNSITAEALRKKLLARKVMIRNCDNFLGLDERYFRMSLKNREKNTICLSALKQALKGTL